MYAMNFLMYKPIKGLIYQAKCRLHHASAVALYSDEYTSDVDEYGLGPIHNSQC